MQSMKPKVNYLLLLLFLSHRVHTNDDLAKWKTSRANQSSTIIKSNYVLSADNALKPGCSEFSQTQNETDPWLEVDLQLNA